MLSRFLILVLNQAQPRPGDIVIRIVAGKTEIGLRFWWRQQEGQLECVQHGEVPAFQAAVHPWIKGGDDSVEMAVLGPNPTRAVRCDETGDDRHFTLHVADGLQIGEAVLVKTSLPSDGESEEKIIRVVRYCFQSDAVISISLLALIRPEGDCGRPNHCKDSTKSLPPLCLLPQHRDG